MGTALGMCEYGRMDASGLILAGGLSLLSTISFFSFSDLDLLFTIHTYATVSCLLTVSLVLRGNVFALLRGKPCIGGLE